MATAQTGTGKTAGFVLPILDRLAVAPRQKGAGRRIRALILTPTRELAVQVEQHIRMLGAYASFVSTTVYGGVSMRAQIQTLQRGVDILVATPGRLLDHVQQRTIDLRNVEIFVLDEADRMLDMGFMPDVRRIASLLSPERQTLMFSATFCAQTRVLANATLRSPVTIDVAHVNQTTDLVTQSVYMIAQEQKSALLKHLITTEDLQQVLVFTKTKHGADRLASALERAGITADSIHGDKRQAQRTRTLQEFKRGGLQALVATDVAARGIDISGLPSVVNYDLPMTPEGYVHRIGRTGRAGIKGQAISLVTPSERGAILAVERHLKYKIERRTPSNFQFQASEGASKHAYAERPHTERPDRSRDEARSHHRPKHEGPARPPYQERSFASERKPSLGAPSNGTAGPRRSRPTEAPRADRGASIGGGFQAAGSDFTNRPRRAGRPAYPAGRSFSARSRSY